MADLIWLAPRGHGEAVRTFLGSVSEYCATHANCPVVVVRIGQSAVGTGEVVGSAATN